MCLPVGNYRQEVHLLYFARRMDWHAGNKSFNNVFVGREVCHCHIQYRWRINQSLERQTPFRTVKPLNT